MKSILQLASAYLLALGMSSGVTVLCAETPAEETSALSASASVSLVSDYMFRGFNLYDGTSVQPSAGLSYDTGFGALSGSLWAHISADDDEQVEKFFELDYTLSYSLEFEYLSVEAGHVWYTYPDEDDNLTDSNEIFGSFTLNDEALGSPLPLSPSFSVYHDYRLVNGQYYELGLSHSFDGECTGLGFELSPFIAFGFVSESTPLYQKNGLVQSTFGVSSTVPMGDALLLGVSLSYTKEFDDYAVDEFWINTSFSWES